MSGCKDQAAASALKSAVKLVIDKVGGIDAAAACTRVGRSHIADYARRGVIEKFMPIDVALDLDRCAEQPVITEALARMQGYQLHPVELHAEGDVARSMEKVAMTSGQLLASTLAALADNHVTVEEAMDLDRGLAELVRVAQAGRGVLRGIIGKPVEAAVVAEAVR